MVSLSIPIICVFALIIVAGLSFCTFVGCMIVEIKEFGDTAVVARIALGVYFISCAILMLGLTIEVLVWLIS